MTQDEPTVRPSPADTLHRIASLIGCATERAGWIHSAEVVRDLLGVDVVVAVDDLGDARGALRAGIGLDEMQIGTVIPLPPGSQARFALDAGLCVTGDLPAEQRFEPSPFLLSNRIRSSMTTAIELPDGARAIVGAHARHRDAFDDDDIEAFVSVARVIGATIAQLRRRDELELGARIDALTGVMNRASILHQLDGRIADPSQLSVLLVDVDGFKNVNDSLGHGAGDTVLRTIAQRIEGTLGPSDRLGRLGGDEFLLVTDSPESERLAERLVGQVEATIMIDADVIQLSASVGVARRRPDDDAMGLVDRADRLMYRAKSSGRGEVCSDAPAAVVPARPSDTDSRSTAPPATRAAVAEAIAGLRLVVQPIIDPIAQHVHGVEVLTRGPVGHALEMPDRLFPSATTFSMLGDLELASKELAFRMPLDDGVRLYLNFEPVLLCSESWLERLTEAWASAPASPPVTVELTERAVLQSPGRLVRAIEVCRDLGWQIALDDVGSRSESLAALRWIDPDIVKLDMGLISSDNTAHSTHVVAAIAAFRGAARTRHVRVIAEGVETLEDAHYADVLGADLLQGFLFGRPAPVEDLQIDEHRHPVQPVPVPPRADGQRIATKRELIAMTRHVEASVRSSDTILVASIQHGDHVSAQTRRQYESLARRCGFVGLVGVKVSEIDEHHLAGVRLADVDEDDPMAAQWHVVSLSATSSIALLATELDGSSATDVGDLDRLFRYQFVTDPRRVERAARDLLRHF